MKINNTNSVYFGHGISEPIGLEYIAASLKKTGYSYSFISRRELEVSLKSTNRKVSLFSSTSAEWNTVLKLNKTAKAKGNITVIGGYHITGTYKFTNVIPFEAAVIGEGENTILQVILDIEKGKTKKGNNTRFYFSEQIKDINKLPFPHREKTFLNQYKIADLNYPASTNQKNTALMLGSRGCYNNCSFCASSSMWGRGLRLRDPNNIIDELKQLKRKFDTNFVVFVDQALGQHTKWTEELCYRLIEEDLGIKWYLQTNITLKKKLIPLMAKAGCTKIGFGVEGISPSAAEIIKPIHNDPFNITQELTKMCNEYGIFVKAYLILGFPWENIEIIGEYFQWLPLLKVNSIKFSFFTLFPGTQDWESYKHRLGTQNWDDFDLIKRPSVYNPEISVEEYKRIREELFQVFYTAENFKVSTHKLLEKFPEYVACYEEFHSFLHIHNMLPANMTFDEWLPGIYSNKTSELV